jgi:hypothetical protein
MPVVGCALVEICLSFSVYGGGRGGGVWCVSVRRACFDGLFSLFADMS